MLTVQGNGASGSPITIKFEPGAVLRAPYWSGSTGAINIASRSYIVVDGGTNGIIENTANGTTLTYQHSSTGVAAARSLNCEVKNLTIANMYVHTSPSDSSGSASNANAVEYTQSTGLTVDHNTIHDCGWCISGYGNGLTVHDNQIYNMINAVTYGVSTANYSNLTIYGNHFHDMSNWDTTNDAYHKEAIHIWGHSGYNVNGVSIFDNVFDGTIGCCQTAWVDLEDSVSNARVYNNLMIMPSGTLAYNGQVAFYGYSGHVADSNAAYNNTFIDKNSGYSGTIGVEVLYNTHFNFRNNIIMGPNFDITLSNTSVGTITNNVYDNSVADYGSGSTFQLNGRNYTTLTAWQAACACDQNSVFASGSQISLSGSGTLGSGSVAIGAGANLTGLGIATLDKDPNGIQRASSGPWDAGAYAYGSSAAGPAPPSGLTAAAN